MSATYNWTYKPGVTNKYGITIDASDDGVCPNNACYAALFGNDITGNGSRLFPFRTLNYAINYLSSIFNGIIVVGSGVYRENGAYSNSNYIVGDGDVVIDIGNLVNGYWLDSEYPGVKVFNIKFRGCGVPLLDSIYSSPYNFEDCIFNNCAPVSASQNSSYRTVLGMVTTSVISNYNRAFSLGQSDTMPTSTQAGYFKNLTFVNCNNFIFTVGNYDSLVFYNCNISFDGNFSSNYYPVIKSCLFFQCNFRFSGIQDRTPGTLGGALYPSVPDGFIYIDNYNELLTAYQTAFPVVSQPLLACNIADPLFNNPTIGDYSLQFGSPAKSLSYFGTYVGARSVAYPVTISATESAGGFDFSTIVNLSVSNNSITLVNPVQNGSIQTGLFANNSGRQLARLPVYGFNADRNGQYIDSISDLSGSVQQAGDTLTVPTPYLVETGSITYNGGIYQPGDRLTTVEGVTSFSSDFGGTLREITEAPERHTIMMRCGNGGETVTAGSALTAGYWYYVISGSITYNGTAYGGGQSFKAFGSGGFSGSGNVITALGPESFNHYEPGIQPTSNNEGDTRTGAILRGNGDPAYVRGGYGVQEFPINARFIQLYYIINVANLKP